MFGILSLACSVDVSGEMLKDESSRVDFLMQDWKSVRIELQRVRWRA